MATEKEATAAAMGWGGKAVTDGQEAVIQVAKKGERKEAGPMEARMEEARAAAEGLTVTAAMEVMAPLEETCS